MAGDRSGAKLEQEVEQYLREHLLPELLGCDPERTKVFRQKAYYSAARGSNIKADVSVEFTLKNATHPFLTWIWECKDYSSPVGIADIEEFDSKLRQIGEHNTKGTLVSRHGFQKSAIAFAKSRGIGLVRLIGGEAVTYIYSPAGGDSRSPAQRVADALVSIDDTHYPISGLLVSGSLFATTEGFGVYLAREVSDLCKLPQAAECESCGDVADVRPRDVLHFMRFVGDPKEYAYFRTYSFCKSCVALFRGGGSANLGCLGLAFGIGALLVTILLVFRLAWPWWSIVGGLFAGLAITVGAFRIERFLLDRVATELTQRLRRRHAFTAELIYPQWMAKFFLVRIYNDREIEKAEWTLAALPRPMEVVLARDLPASA